MRSSHEGKEQSGDKFVPRDLFQRCVLMQLYVRNDAFIKKNLFCYWCLVFVSYFIVFSVRVSDSFEIIE